MARFRVEELVRLPENFDDFVEEIAESLVKLYGPKAGDYYRRSATSHFEASLASGTVIAYSAIREAVAGIIMAVVRENVGHISFVHVLESDIGQGVESILVERIVTDLRERPIVGVLCETVTTAPMDLLTPFRRLHFEQIERVLMIASLESGIFSVPGLLTSEPWAAGEREAIASVIVDAYQDHPGRRLHTEVRTREGALGFLRGVSEGSFGATRAAFCRVVRREGRIAGVIVGCEAAPEIAFVLQVVVHPDFQNQGLGKMLIRDLANCCREAGYTRMALGVTATNPARKLYERLGFRHLLPVNAYVWWREAFE